MNKKLFLSFIKNNKTFIVDSIRHQVGGEIVQQVVAQSKKPKNEGGIIVRQLGAQFEVSLY